MRTLDILWLTLVITIAQSAAAGMQHLVAPGDDWAELADRLEPGDEVILMPGEHKPASMDDLRGERGNPITIRSVSPHHRATIKASRKGIRLRRPQHVVIRDLDITGATISGISISGPHADIAHKVQAVRGNGAAREPEASLDAPWVANVTIQNVRIERTGPRGRRHAIRLAALEDVRVENCTIRGWGGSGINVIASRNVTIERCTFIGRVHYSQENAVEVRAGSEDVRIQYCTIADAGTTAVSLGGHSRVNEFRPPLPDANGASPAGEKRFEASRVTVRRNEIHGGESAFIVRNVSDSVIRNNVVNSPSAAIYALLDDLAHPTIDRTKDVRFVANLFLWKQGEMQLLAYAEEGADPEGLVLERNMWWSPDLAERREELGDPVGDVAISQVMDMDPELDDQGLPTNRRARMFGPHAP